ncbi:MAG: glycosyl hydrolase, partial [Chitinophagaceae bacterium]
EVDITKLPSLYKDIAVMAFRLPENDQSLYELHAKVSSNKGAFTLEQLIDGDLSTTVALPPDTVAGYSWIQFEFPEPQTIKGITMVGGGNPGMFGNGGDASDSRMIEFSNDGNQFTFLSLIPTGAILQQTINIPATTAKYFRIKIKNAPPKINVLALMVGLDPGKPDMHPSTEIAEIVLHTTDRIQMFEEKDAFAPVTDLYKKYTTKAIDIVSPESIIDLTDKMKPDGKLDWTVPEGKWKIVRFGYSLLGIENHPASPEATGPEVDKLDPVAIKSYFTNYLNQYKNATGGLMGLKGGLQFMVTDSWEAGAQNWTANLPQEFLKRRGYSLLPWLPVFTGHIVKSAEASEQFLFDFRKTLGDLLVEYHYDALTDILKEYGMKRYTESHENGRAMIADGMEVKRKSAIPMSAMWTSNELINQNDQTYHTMDIRESGSVAHIYGQNIVAAESLTALGVPSGAWSFSPEILKPTVDLEMAHGLNRFVIHTSVHQPVDDKIPGLGLGPFGQWFNRHDTWSEQAKVWADYLSRSSYMLQQGKFVADILYYYGEDNNITSLFGKKPPIIPEGYNYDFINSDALINQLTVKDGKLVTPSGMGYRLLVLDSNAIKMTLPVLKKISQLVKDGAIIAGVQVISSPSLADDKNQYNLLVEQIWNRSNKNVMTGIILEDVMAKIKLKKDFSYDDQGGKLKLFFVHRKLNDRDVYWVNNRTTNSLTTQVKFHITGLKPVIWHPENGSLEQVSYNISNGETTVDLPLVPNDAVFVIFKDRAIASTVKINRSDEKIVAEIINNWNVSFQEGRGAPSSIKMDHLESFTKNENPAVKYFSGTASYTTDFNLDKLDKSNYYIDLGEVKELAEVLLNGKSAGIIWKRPFVVDVSAFIKKGKNQLEVKVTNLWVNRLIGDMQPGMQKIK